MPIGVPKVPFRIPGEEESTWVDIYNRLYRQRMLFLGQNVNDEIANQLIGVMIYLHGEDENPDIYLYINSPGGAVFAGIGVYDAMHFIGPEVHTICIGMAVSMASLILAGGEFTKRVAFPHSRIMIHQPSSTYYQGQTTECLLEAEEILILREYIIKMYMERTNKPEWVISQDLERDSFMSPEEAQTYGIIDMVMDGSSEIPTLLAPF